MVPKSNVLIIDEEDVDWVYDPKHRVHWKMLGPGDEERGPCMQLIRMPAGYRQPRQILCHEQTAYSIHFDGASLCAVRRSDIQ